MKLLKILTVTLIFFSHVGIAADSPLTPTEVVQSFCENDFNGAGLSSDTNSTLCDLTIWDAGPGWDTSVIVDRYTVGPSQIKWGEAKVEVIYQVIGTLDVNFYQKKGEDKVTYVLTKVEGLWKIKSPQIPPHISIGTAKEHLSKLANELDPQINRDEKNRLLTIVSQLESINSNKRSQSNR